MKKLLLAAAALGAVASTPAMATTGDSTATYEVSGTVNASCNANTGGTIAFTTITTNSDGTLASGQSKTSGASAVYCNGVNSTITVSGSSIVNSVAADNAEFTGTLTFTPSAKIDGAAGIVNVGAGTTALGAKAGDLTVTAGSLTATGGKRPYAGAYTGNVTVTLSPAA